MTEINLDYLKHAVLDVLDESIQEGYDLDIILKSATLVWDDTAVQVKGNDFIMVFDYAFINYNFIYHKATT